MKLTAAARLALLAVFLALPVLSGCSTTPEKDAVKQERAFFDVEAPRFLKYSAADLTLSDAKKKDDVDFVEAYRSWLEDREKRLAGAK